MHTLDTIIIAVTCGVFLYTISHWLRLPAILFYLVAGVILGPVGLGVLAPGELGPGLLIIVEMAVAIILFEGGLSLSEQSFRKAPSAIIRLLAITMPVTGIMGGLLGYHLLDLSPRIALVFGTIIVVTGPTVIGPLLRSISLTSSLESMLRWESIWGDVIGVMLSAVALKILTVPESGPATMAALVLLKSILTGGAVGLAAGILLSRYVLPWTKSLGDDSLPGIIAFAAALFVFYLSNKVVEGSGPLAAAVTGFTLSRFATEGLHSVRQFKEQLSTLMISTLFILLVASADPRNSSMNWGAIVMISLLLGGVIRPLSVFLGLAGSGIAFKEQIYVGFISPRGIIALAAASYALLAVPEKAAELETMFYAVFAIIFLSGSVATIFGSPLAHLLGVAIPRTQGGILFVGGNPLSFLLAEEVQKHVPVAFLNTDDRMCILAHRSDKDRFVCANALDEHVYKDAAEEGFTRVLAVTEDQAVNRLVCEVAAHHFKSEALFCAYGGRKPLRQVNSKVGVRTAFGSRAAMDDILQAFAQGRAKIETIDSAAQLQDEMIPLCVILPKGGVEILCGDTVAPEGKLICLWITEPLSEELTGSDPCAMAQPAT